MSSNRPIGITVIGAYYLIYGLIAVVLGIFVTVPGAVLVFCFPAMVAGGVWNLITGFLNLALGASVWTGKDWARWVVSGLALLGIITHLLGGGLALGSLINIVINGAVIVYMQSKEATQFFATN